jgi:hypothetical protein
MGALMKTRTITASFTVPATMADGASISMCNAVVAALEVGDDNPWDITGWSWWDPGIQDTPEDAR